MPNSYLGFIDPFGGVSEAEIEAIVTRTKTEISTDGLNMEGGRFTNVPEPEEPFDVATKEYVDRQTVSSGRTIVSQWAATNFGNPIADLPHLVVWQKYTFLAFLDANDNTRIVFYDNEQPISGEPTSFTNFDGKSLSDTAPLAFTLGNVNGTDRLFLLLKPLTGIQIWEYAIIPFYDPLRAWRLEVDLPIPCNANFMEYFEGNLYFSCPVPTPPPEPGPVQTLVEYRLGDGVTDGSYVYLRDLPGGDVFDGVRDFVITSSFYIFWVEGEQLYRSTYTVNPPNSGSYFDLASVTKTPWMSGELQTAYQHPSFYIASASLKVRGDFVYMTAGNDNGAIYRANINDPDGYFQLYARNVDEVQTFDFDANHVYTVSDNTNAYNYEIGRGYDGPGSFMTNPFTANADANLKRVINLSDPINDQDAATKAFVVTEIDTLKTLVETNDTDITTLQTDVKTLQTGAVVSNGKITTLEIDVNTLQTTTTVSDGKITTLENTTVKNPMLATLNMNGFGATGVASIVGVNTNTFELARVKKIGGVANSALQIALGVNSLLSITGGNTDVGGFEIVSLGAPSIPSAAANRQYVDNLYGTVIGSGTSNRIYYNSTQRSVTFEGSLGGGLPATGVILSFERVGNSVTVSIPAFDLRVNSVPIAQVPYIQAVDALPVWATASNTVLPCIIRYRTVPSAGRIQFLGRDIRLTYDLAGTPWVETNAGANRDHGFPNDMTFTYNGLPLKAAPLYKGTTVGSDVAGVGDILWPP
jgi:hypothetical protein